MNKALYIIFSFFLLNGTFFAQNDNNIVIFAEEPKLFTFYLNDEKVNDMPQNSVKAFNVPPGWQKIKIEVVSEKETSVFLDSIHIKNLNREHNTEFTYMMRAENKGGKLKYKLVFMSEGILSGPPKPPIPEEPKEVIPLIDNSIYGNLYKAVENKPNFFMNYDELSNSCKIILTDKEIQYALTLIDKTNDIEDRFKYVDLIIQRNCYNTRQIAKLIATVPIELDKLKLVRKAYPHFTDIHKAAELESSFKYQAVKDQYKDFLREVAIKKEQNDLHCKEALSDDQFKTLSESFKKIGNEYDRTKIVKKSLITNCFNCAQMTIIMLMFTHDRERLEIARSAYPVIVDKENYKQLAENFQFSETKAEFLNGIQ